MVVLDTNIIIDHLRQKGEKTKLMDLVKEYGEENLAISVISVQELYEGRSTLKEKEETYLLATITPLKIFSYTYEIAQKAGETARDVGRPIELADAAIGATAVINGASLATLNKKDFKGIRELELV